MSQRLNLHEFQQNLAERLLTARRSGAGQSLLEIESGTDGLPGGRRWLVDPAHSGEIVPLPPLTPVPLTQPWFAGIANIRGSLFSVVDFAAWRGGQPTPRTAQARLLLIGVRESSALLVEHALGLRAQGGLQVITTAADPSSDDTGLPASGLSSPSDRNQLPDGKTQNRFSAGAAAWRGACLTDAQSGAQWTFLNIPALLVTPTYLNIAL